MEESIFSKIIKGEIPCHKIYEDDNILAFLDIYPVQPGMTVVVPKKQVEFVWDLSDTDYTELMSATNKVAKNLRKLLKTKYVGVKIEGTEVPHAHVKLIPFNSVAEFNAHQNTDAEPDHIALESMAEKLKFE